MTDFEKGFNEELEKISALPKSKHSLKEVVDLAVKGKWPGGVKFKDTLSHLKKVKKERKTREVERKLEKVRERHRFGKALS